MERSPGSPLPVLLSIRIVPLNNTLYLSFGSVLRKTLQKMAV